MSKLFKCGLCGRTFTRKEHLVRHYNRKIKCFNPINPVLSYDDIINEENNNLLQNHLTSGNIIVKKIGGEHTENLSNLDPNLDPNLRQLPNLDPNLRQLPNLVPNLRHDIMTVNMEENKVLSKPVNMEENKEIPKPENKVLSKPVNMEENKEIPKPENKVLSKPVNKVLPNQTIKSLLKPVNEILPNQTIKSLLKPENEEFQEIKKKSFKNKTATNRIVNYKEPLSSKEKEGLKNELENIRLLNALREKYTEDELKKKILKAQTLFELKDFKEALIKGVNQKYKQFGKNQITDIDNMFIAINEINKYNNKLKIFEKIKLTDDEINKYNNKLKIFGEIKLTDDEFDELN